MFMHGMEHVLVVLHIKGPVALWVFWELSTLLVIILRFSL